MKAFNLDTITDAEQLTYREVIRSSILRYVHNLVLVCGDLGLELNTSNHGIAEEFKLSSIALSTNNTSLTLTREMADKITRLWADPSIKEAHRRYEEEHRSSFSKRNVEDFLNSIDRFVGDSFEVSHDDILTLDSIDTSTGVRELEWAVENCSFQSIDMSAQRGSMKKWLPCFQDITAVIFCAALDEFDMWLPDAPHVNRMWETLKDFDVLVSTSWFAKTNFILLLTRKDIFEEKIKRGVSLQKCFPEYCGNSFDDACTFVRDKFLSKSRSGNDIYTHITVGSNTENI